MTELISHVVGGKRRASTEAATIDVVDPATDEVLGRIPGGGEADADMAVAAAAEAAPSWARTAPAERAAAVRAWARTLGQHVDELAELQTRENGTPVAESRDGVEAGIAALEQYAELGPLHRGGTLQGSWDATDLTVPEPFGVAGLLVPWNFPVGIACELAGAALVTGNSVVLKPSEKTPLSTARMVDLAEEAGFPAGVLNLLLGDERSGRALADHPTVAVVCHVGSVATGREVAERCARRLAKVVLELGGKDPLLVDEGVDPAWAAEQAAAGAFSNAGQICTSVERIYVHQAVAEAFLDELVRLAKARRVGPGIDPATEMGPLIDRAQRDHVHSHVTEAVAAGATLLAGGEVPGGSGSFYPPTVLAGVDDDMAVMQDETFGPVAPVAVVGSFAEAIERANVSQYGLAATVLTPSAANAQRAWRELRVGTVKVNDAQADAPGTAAHPGPGSGLGFGYGPELLDELTRTKAVHLRTPPT